MQNINKKSCFTILLFFVLTYVVYKKFNYSIKSKEDDVNFALNFSKSLKADQNRIHIFDGYQLPSDILLKKLSGFKIDTIAINKLDFKKPKIIFWFSDMSCESCIIQELTNLKALEKEIGRDNIIYLGSFANIRKAISFGKVNFLEDSNFYFVNYSALGANLESEHLPFVFILDQSMKINTPFFPRSEMPEVSVDYYKIIKKKYF